MARSLDTDERRIVFGLLLVGAVLESLLGMWQFLSQSAFGSTLLGMSTYDSWQAGVSVLKNESGRWLRAYGTFPHPNILGTYLGSILSGTVGYVVLRKKDRMTVWLPGMIPIMLAGLIVSFSRTAWAGLVLGLAVLAFGVLWRGGLGQKRRLAKVLMTLTVSGGVFTGILHETVFPRFESGVIGEEGSVADRTVLFHQAEGIISGQPFGGVGAGNYTLAVMHLHPEIPVWDVQPVHNVFVLVFAELGMVGGLVFIALVLSVFIRIFKTLFIDEWQKEKAIAGIAFLALVPSLFLDHFLWDSHFGLLLFFLLGALLS